MGGDGLQGITGPLGYPETGNVGITGLMGSTGFFGLQGIDNIGLQGYQGFTGFFGQMGQTGATGLPGVQGSQGIECAETGLHAPIGNDNSINFGGDDNVRFYFYRDSGLTDLTSCTGVIRYMTGVNQSGENTHTSISWRDMLSGPSQPVYGSMSGVLSNFLHVVSTVDLCYEPTLIQIGSGSKRDECALLDQPSQLLLEYHLRALLFRSPQRHDHR